MLPTLRNRSRIRARALAPLVVCASLVAACSGDDNASPLGSDGGADATSDAAACAAPAVSAACTACVESSCGAAQATAASDCAAVAACYCACNLGDTCCVEACGPRATTACLSDAKLLATCALAHCATVCTVTTPPAACMPVPDSGGDQAAPDAEVVDGESTDSTVPDTGTSDTGTDSSNPADTGASDAASDDGGSDSSAPDSSSADSSVPDSSTADSSTPDSSAADTGAPDAGAPDSSADDSSAPDSGVPDATAPDAGEPDAGAPDAGGLDSSIPLDAGGGDASDDASLIDAGSASVEITNVPASGAFKSRFLVGTASGGGASIVSVQVAVDQGTPKSATGTTNWSFTLPAFKVGTSHAISVTAITSKQQVVGPVTATYVAGANQDVNGDGFPDLLVGAPDTSSTTPGTAYLYASSGGVVVPLGTSTTPTTTFTGLGPEFGFSVALADVNGDGYADVLVTDPSSGAGVAGVPGAAYVFDGLASAGQSVVPSTSAVTTITGVGSEALGVVAAGDIDGDGAFDLALGAPQAGTSSAGAVYVFKSTGANGVPSGDTSTATATFTGVAGATFGTHLSFGDVNGDGYADLLAGAPGLSGGGAAAEAHAYVFASPGGGTFLTSGTTAAASTTLTSATQGFGAHVVLGDLNGDGYDDLVVGKPAGVQREVHRRGVRLPIGGQDRGSERDGHVGVPDDPRPRAGQARPRRRGGGRERRRVRRSDRHGARVVDRLRVPVRGEHGRGQDPDDGAERAGGGGEPVVRRGAVGARRERRRVRGRERGGAGAEQRRGGGVRVPVRGEDGGSRRSRTRRRRRRSRRRSGRSSSGWGSRRRGAGRLGEGMGARPGRRPRVHDVDARRRPWPKKVRRDWRRAFIEGS
jgi:hypothetical protein